MKSHPSLMKWWLSQNSSSHQLQPALHHRRSNAWTRSGKSANLKRNSAKLMRWLRTGKIAQSTNALWLQSGKIRASPCRRAQSVGERRSEVDQRGEVMKEEESEKWWKFKHFTRIILFGHKIPSFKQDLHKLLTLFLIPHLDKYLESLFKNHNFGRILCQILNF